MTKEEIEIQKALGTYLSMKWKECNELHEEANKLYEEANKLKAESNKLRDDGFTVYEEAVEEVYGDKKIRIDWATGKVTLYD